jgi:hypothetical protein
MCGGLSESLRVHGYIVTVWLQYEGDVLYRTSLGPWDYGMVGGCWGAYTLRLIGNSGRILGRLLVQLATGLVRARQS